MSGLFYSGERDIRTKLNEALQRYGIKQVDVARETGIHHSTLSLWLQGKLKGNNIKIEDTLETWLNNLYSNKPKLVGSSLTRLELLKGKSDKIKFSDDIDNNFGFGNLIPININIELEGKKFKEIFFWDLNEPYLKLENFAKILVDDNQLPSSFENEIVNQMNKQINLYRKFERVEGEIIRTIKLDIRIDDIVLTDQFEWDINNPDNNPDAFALSLCGDLGLGFEFILPIAHSIKEQILDHQKTFMSEKNIIYQKMYKAQEFQNNYYSTSNIIRDVFFDNSEWQPNVKKISSEEIKKLEKKEERKIRYTQRKK